MLKVNVQAAPRTVPATSTGLLSMPYDLLEWLDKNAVTLGPSVPPTSARIPSVRACAALGKVSQARDCSRAAPAPG